MCEGAMSATIKKTQGKEIVKTINCSCVVSPSPLYAW